MFPSLVRGGGRLRASLLASLLVSLVGASYGDTLREVFERSWANSPSGRTVTAKQAEVAANLRAADAFIAGAPQVGLSQRTDRWTTDQGMEEGEIGISVPLWLPGQRAARQGVAATGEQENQSSTTAARLALAGELRTLLWTVYLAQAEAGIAAERLKTAEKLEADVARRVKVGEMARTDLLLARQETASARAASAAVQSRLVGALQRYQVLTGNAVLPDDPNEPIGPVSSALHPRLVASRAVVDSARARLKLAQGSRRDAPSLGLQYRQERDEFGGASRSSVALGLTLPLATEARNAPLLASATTIVVQAEAELQRLQAELVAAEREAEALLEATRLGADLALDRERAAAERLSLMRRSFDLGETALVELIRAQSQATEASIDLARSRIQLSAAHANLNQARGITP